MLLDLWRDDIQIERTLGILKINTIHVCETVEDADRKLEAGGLKIDKRTAIPRGRYRLILNRSERFSQLASRKAGKPVNVIMPLLLDVPQYQGVRIHWGNTELDTEGCIIVGRRAPSGVYNSRIEYERLMQIHLLPAHARQEEMWITVH